MAEMTIVIQAVDKATAEIAKVTKSLGSVTSAVQNTTEETKKNIEATNKQGASFGNMTVAYKMAMRVMAGSTVVSDLSQSLATLAGRGVDAAAAFVGLADAARWTTNAMTASKILDDLELAQKILARMEADALRGVGGSDITERLRVMRNAIYELNKEASKQVKVMGLGATIEQYDRLNALGQKRINTLEAETKAQAKRDAAVGLGTKMWREMEAAEAAAKSAFLWGQADERLREENAQLTKAIETNKAWALSMREGHRELERLQSVADLFGGVTLPALNDALASAEMKSIAEDLAAFAFGFDATTEHVGILAAALGDLFPKMEDEVDGATMSVDELDAALQRLIGTSEHIEDPEKSGFVAFGTQQLKELTQLADDFGLRSLPSMASAIASLELRATAEEMASLAYGFGASETQVAALTAALGDLEKKEKVFLLTNEEISNQIGGDFADAFMSIIDGTKGVAQAFAEMVQSILADLLRMAVQKYITRAIFNALGGGGGGLGELGGGGSGGDTPIFSPPPGSELQHGGTVNAGQTVLVGERGPELFRPHQSGYVNNNANTMGGGGTTVNFVISAVDGPSVAAMLRREKDTIKAVVASAMATDTRFRASLN